VKTRRAAAAVVLLCGLLRLAQQRIGQMTLTVSMTVSRRFEMRCTCDSIRENSQGVSYSLAMLGVECGACEALNAEYEFKFWWDSLTPAQQISERWSNATAHIAWVARRPMQRQTNTRYYPF
jgi:hypothetical protein